MGKLRRLHNELRNRDVKSTLSAHEREWLHPGALHLVGREFSAIDELLTNMPGIEVMLFGERRDEPERFASVKEAADYICGDYVAE